MPAHRVPKCRGPFDYEVWTWRETVAQPKLKEFCEKFILDIGEPLFMPFIHENEDDALGAPDGYSNSLNDVTQRLRDVFTVRPDESQQDGGDDPIGEVEDWSPPGPS